jgi:hypothetical protein
MLPGTYGARPAPASAAPGRARLGRDQRTGPTQRPTQEAMGGNAVRSQLDVRICLRSASAAIPT